MMKNENVSSVELTENSNILNMQTNSEQDKNNEDPERDKQSEANDDEDKLVENVNRVQRGPGRPKLIRTGKPGRPRKAYNKLNAIGVANIQGGAEHGTCRRMEGCDAEGVFSTTVQQDMESC